MEGRLPPICHQPEAVLDVVKDALRAPLRRWPQAATLTTSVRGFTLAAVRDEGTGTS
jgi:hypothetical protein